MAAVIRRSLAGIGVLAALLLAALPAGAQSLTTGTVGGVVRDGEGRVLTDALIRVTGRGAGVTRSTRSVEGGRFELPFLPPGEYEVRVERLGYRPKRVQRVPIRPGQTVDLEVVLVAAPPPVERVDVEEFQAAALGASRPGQGEWFTAFDLTRLPSERRELTDLVRLSAVANAELSAEGLPASLGGLVIDGIPFEAARHPGLGPARQAASAFPLSAFEYAELVTNGVDMEWSEFAGGILSGHTRRGTPDLAMKTFGVWSGGPLHSSKYFDAADLSQSVVQGGILFTGPVIRDTAHFVVGVEGWRLDTPLPRPWEREAPASQLVPVAQNLYGVDLSAYQRPRVVRTDAVSAFGRFDWQVAADHALSVRTSIASLPSTAQDLGPAHAASLGSVGEGADFSLGATLTSRFSDRWMQEFRVGLSSSRREYLTGGADAEELLGAAVPFTRMVGDGLEFGADPSLPGRFRRTDVYGNQSIYHVRGAHRLKFGLGVSVAFHDQTYVYGREGEFTFGGIEQFERREGAFLQAVGPLPSARFNSPQLTLFAQDAWSVAPGLRIVGGLRLDSELLPLDEVAANPEWSRLTGIDRTNIPSAITKFSPRLGFTWDVQGQGAWVLRGGVGVYYDRVDPGILGELVTYDGRVRVRRGLGILSQWPGLPDEASAPTLGPRLALIGPKFMPPRTARASVGITRSLGAATALHLSGTYRNTVFLPRRHDLNLLPGAVAQDQYGRPIHGELVQQGGLVAAEPGSNRRFPEFDVVSALNPDGESRYLGLSLGLEHRAAGPLGLFARYTFSRTTDNWLAAGGRGPDAELPPFPGRIGGSDWADGRSDFDVPHRLALGAEFAVGALRIAGVYRFRSGVPFTPGFRAGVDANGDGSARNDPAYIDGAAPGIADLLAQHDCLRDHVGAFAERNSCRGPAIHGLDLRLSLGLVRLGGYPAELVVDAFNLIESDVAEPDGALYLVDPNGTLLDDGAGHVTVPLVANPNFGQPLARRSTGRALRVGLRINY